MKITFTQLIFLITLSLITGCKNEPSTKRVDRENTILLEDLKEDRAFLSIALKTTFAETSRSVAEILNSSPSASNKIYAKIIYDRWFT